MCRNVYALCIYRYSNRASVLHATVGGWVVVHDAWISFSFSCPFFYKTCQTSLAVFPSSSSLPYLSLSLSLFLSPFLLKKKKRFRTNLDANLVIWERRRWRRKCSIFSSIAAAIILVSFPSRLPPPSRKFVIQTDTSFSLLLLLLLLLLCLLGFDFSNP